MCSVYKAAIKPHYVYLMDDGYGKLTVVGHWMTYGHVFPILIHIVREYLQSDFTGDVLNCQAGLLGELHHSIRRTFLKDILEQVTLVSSGSLTLCSLPLVDL